MVDLLKEKILQTMEDLRKHTLHMVNMVFAKTLQCVSYIPLYENIFDPLGMWEEKHGPEPGLPGHSFTSKQLFWIALAQVSLSCTVV